MNNLMQLLGMLKGGNPQQILGNIINKHAKDNPMMGNVIGMVQNRDSKGLEEFARNLAKEKGLNYDEMSQEIRKQLNV